MRIRLTDSQMEHAHNVAKSRRKNPHTKTRKFAKNRSDWDIDFLGAKAEVAVCLPFGQEVEMGGDPKSSNNYDLGVDVILNGVPVQIKATEHKNGRLIFKKDYQFNAECYILAHVDEDIVKIQGWISQKKLEKKIELHESGSLKDTWVLENRHLFSIYHLIDAFREKRKKEGVK